MSDEEKEKYPIIQQILNNFEDREEIHLWESEMEDLIGAVQMQLAYDSNYGIRKERAEGEKYGKRELAFQQEWLKRNHPSAGYGYYGIIQALFRHKKVDALHEEEVFHISNRERVIVATIIQWLGSNIGFEFLETTLKKCGYVVQTKESYEEHCEELARARRIIKKAEEMFK